MSLTIGVKTWFLADHAHRPRIYTVVTCVCKRPLPCQRSLTFSYGPRTTVWWNSHDAPQRRGAVLSRPVSLGRDLGGVLSRWRCFWGYKKAVWTAVYSFASKGTATPPKQELRDFRIVAKWDAVGRGIAGAFSKVQGGVISWVRW